MSRCHAHRCTFCDMLAAFCRFQAVQTGQTLVDLVPKKDSDDETSGEAGEAGETVRPKPDESSLAPAVGIDRFPALSPPFRLP